MTSAVEESRVWTPTYYCDPCAKKFHYEQTVLTTRRRRCEQCGNTARCNVKPTKKRK